MLDEVELKTYAYSGMLAPICENFIREKRAVGYLYNSEAKKLSEFSRFTLDYDYPPNTLPKDRFRAKSIRKVFFDLPICTIYAADRLSSIYSRSVRGWKISQELCAIYLLS